MQKINSKLTVFFDDPFWVGVYERAADGNLEVCKITFGAEPKDYEVYGLLLQNWSQLRFSPAIQTSGKADIKRSPKRMQRLIKKQLTASGIGTSSQQALKRQQKERKTSHKEKRREEKDEQQQRQFELRKQKKKAKHRGR